MRVLIAAACLAMVSADGCVPASFPVDYGERGRAAAQAEMQFVSDPNERDDDGPATDECPNCDGEGEVGDGRNARVCPACEGTGKRTGAANEPVSDPVGNAVIVMKSRPDCAFCDRWWLVERPKYIRQGWAVRKEYAESGPVPRFTLMNGSDVIGEHVGFMSTRDARAIVSPPSSDSGRGSVWGEHANTVQSRVIGCPRVTVCR